MVTMRILGRSFVALLITLALPTLTRAGIIVYSLTQNGGLAGFNLAAGAPPVSIHFDSIAPGTNITGSTIAGVQFLGPNAPLVVVRGADTFTPDEFIFAVNPATNKLLPTSGLNVLIPGGTRLGAGPNNAIENDDLTLVFATALAAFGFDHLSQSADGVSFTSISVYNQANLLLFSGMIPISNLGGGGAPAGPDFWGVVGTGSDLIGRIVIDEGDNNGGFPDSNIGFDTFRFMPQVVEAVPEPSSLLLALGGIGMAFAVRRRRSMA
jgi:PEP-CTERM motif